VITELTLRNFKSISEQTYEFSHFDLLVGHSGKSTIHGSKKQERILIEIRDSASGERMVFC
jgi:predicted ATPase